MLLANLSTVEKAGAAFCRTERADEKILALVFLPNLVSASLLYEIHVLPD